MRNLDGVFGLFFASLPNLEELTAVKATIQTKKDDEISAIQPMCCRELIFTEPKVLVSPLIEDKNKLFLITQKAILHSSQFQELLQKLNISSQETEPVDLTESLFQFCFSFTIKQKLAPLWNKAGDFLVQGRDFMQEKSKLNAVSLEVTMSDKICIGLQAYSLKSTPCKPEHFTASTRALEEFSTYNKAVITDAAISDDLCFVLPSLKKGRIFSITHNLPEECPFASYEDLRKHWKLMYGYRLPPQENVFYNVHFYYIRGKLFTYPASCIRSSQALVSPRCDHRLIFNNFLRDLSGRMPSVCGTPLAFTSSPLYPTNRLQQATHANHSNLTRTEPQLNHCRPFAITRDYIRQAADSSPSASLLSFQAASSQIHQTESNKTVNHQRTMPSVDQQRITPFVNQSRTAPSSTPPFSGLSLETRFVPRFTSNRLVNSSREGTVSCNSTCPSTSAARIVPMFSKKRVQSRGNEPTRKSTPVVTTATSRAYFVGNTVQTQNATTLSSSQPPPHEVRRIENTSQVHIQPQQRRSQNNVNSSVGRDIIPTMQGGSSEISSRFNQDLMIDSIVTNSPVAIHKNVPPVTHSAHFSTHVTKRLPQRRPGLVITQAAPANGHLGASFADNMTQKPRGTTMNLTEQGSNWGVNSSLRSDLSDTPTSGLSISGMFRERTTSVQQLQYEPFSPQSQSSGDLTWKRLVGDFPHEEPPPKKLKSKPKIQESIDVRELALHDQLHKVNAVTLADWLKKRGVAVKSKDKKAELTSKVKQYLGLVPHEQ